MKKFNQRPEWDQDHSISTEGTGDDDDWDFVSAIDDNYHTNPTNLKKLNSEIAHKQKQLVKNRHSDNIFNESVQRNKRKTFSFSSKLGSALSILTKKKTIVSSKKHQSSEIDQKNMKRAQLNNFVCRSDNIFGAEIIISSNETGYGEGYLKSEPEQIGAGGIGFSYCEPETEFQNINSCQFILDDYVGSKARITVHKSPKYWSSSEDAALETAIDKYKSNWKQIEAFLEKGKPRNSSHKTIEDCQKRWKGIKNEGLQNWSQIQDDKLMQLVQLKGKHWSLLVQHFEGATKDKLRKRYDHLQKLKKLQIDDFHADFQQNETVSEKRDQGNLRFSIASSELAHGEPNFFNCMRVDSNMSSIQSFIDFNNISSYCSQEEFKRILRSQASCSYGSFNSMHQMNNIEPYFKMNGSRVQTSN